MTGKSARLCALVFSMGISAAFAEYGDECRALADRLAQEPGSLKVGELDLMKNCVSGLQRGIILGEPAPEPSPAKASGTPDCPAVEPAVVEKPKECPPCAATTCPKREAAPAQPSSPARERAKDRDKGTNSGEDRRLKPYLPQF